MAFPLRLELKIPSLPCEPRPLGDRDGGRKEAAFPPFLSPHLSFDILLSLIPSLALDSDAVLFSFVFPVMEKAFRKSKTA